MMKAKNNTKGQPQVGCDAGFAFRVWNDAASKCVVHASWCFERVMLADFVTIQIRLSSDGWDAILIQTDTREEIIIEYGENFRSISEHRDIYGPACRTPFMAVMKSMARTISALEANQSHGHEYRLIAALRRCRRVMRIMKANDKDHATDGAREDNEQSTSM